MAPIEIFCSVAPNDEKFLTEMAKQLNVVAVAGRAEDSPLFTLWDRSKIRSGQVRQVERDKHLHSAQIILLLISPDLFEQYYTEEIKPAMQRYYNKEAYVIPVLVRPVAGWRASEPGQLRSLPSGGIPITLWANQEEALWRVVEEMIPLIEMVARANEQRIPFSDPAAGTSQPGEGSPMESQASEAPMENRSAPIHRAIFDVEQGRSERFILTRYQPRLKQFHDHAQRHRRTRSRLQWITISVAGLSFLAVLINFLLAFSKSVSPLAGLGAFLSFALTLLMLVCLGLLVTSPAYRKWFKYSQMELELRAEYRMYNDRTDAYAWPEGRERLFRERVDRIISKAEAGTDYLSDVERYV